MQKTQPKTLTCSILSLSLLTVMAGAAVAPALGVIREAFSDQPQLLIQLILSMPALFIFLTNLIFPRLSKKFGSKTLVMAGLLLYTVGGVAAGCFSNIYLVLLMRALVGVGVGIMMPLSTGLLAYYYPPESQAKLSGYASAMNQMGGVIATLLTGVLSSINWRCSFLVYLMGLISIVLCLIFLPNDHIQSGEPEEKKEKESKTSVGSSFKAYYVYIIAMFLLTLCFFLYPANYALETIRFDPMIPHNLIAVIMAFTDIIATLSGFFFVNLVQALKKWLRFLPPVLFLGGFVLLWVGGWAGTLLGSACVGFANGCGIPYLISQGSLKAGKTAAHTVMPLVSAALYLAQFICPFMQSAVGGFLDSFRHPAYLLGIVMSVLYLIWSFFVPFITPYSNPDEKPVPKTSDAE